MDIERSLEDTSNFLKQHQQSSGVPSSDSWTLLHSPISGRGLFASKNLSAGDVVFVDAPLVVGPRTGENSPPLCVGCHRSGTPLVPCSRGCGLPVCDEGCGQSDGHRDECDRLVSWQQDKIVASSWSAELLRALTPIRCLRLNRDQKRFLKCLEAHPGPLHENEVDLLRKLTKISISIEDEEFMRFCCRALDANSFEIVAQVSLADTKPSATESCCLRGLYPLAAMMNNACTSNTRHGFNKNLEMTVTATMDIPEGTEVTTSYFAPLWGTSARRHHLHQTKHFLCFCARCRDPQEGGTRLSALKCINGSCQGSSLNEDPVKIGSKWVCDECGMKVPDKQVRLINHRLGSMLRAVNCNDPLQITAFLRGHRCLFATSNQAIVEMKSCLVWIYGKQHPYLWQDLSDLNLETKEGLCRELLNLLNVLKAGQCRLRGLFLYELHCTLVEKRRRRGNAVDGEEVRSTIDEAASLFELDVSAPPDIWIRRRAECVTEPNTVTEPALQAECVTEPNTVTEPALQAHSDINTIDNKAG